LVSALLALISLIICRFHYAALKQEFSQPKLVKEKYLSFGELIFTLKEIEKVYSDVFEQLGTNLLSF